MYYEKLCSVALYIRTDPPVCSSAVGIFLGLVITLITWPLLYFLPAMPDFKKVKQQMLSHQNILHSDYACMHAVYKPAPNLLNFDPPCKESYFTGYFFMTETAIVFKSDVSSSKYISDTVLYYTSIQSVKKCFIHPNRINDSRRHGIVLTAGLIVTTKNGDRFRFIVGERKKIISGIEINVYQAMEAEKDPGRSTDQSAVQMDRLDERICPYCGSKVTSANTKCKHCNKSFFNNH